MKISSSQICTTTELMREFFAMPDRLIYNMSEKERYIKIHNYLSKKVDQEEAISLGKLLINEKSYYGYKFQDELYVIPMEFFEEDITKVNRISDEKVVIPFKKAN
ncbi:hypothetical protein [Selenihalanaerobacter shriftii]|uniref:Uncharacterized protein n=1 Tax=Selenihalanaerobacter shriftii TaxID=142842 RepID=A0A1T4K030_9FIRM|nr:hypothetical protein [Selenihalanaerobacter shriftii]SJZ35734.1 hypothetical protein SAMN02745118_00528 [Selenihalanaerobacter shriftii]